MDATPEVDKMLDTLDWEVTCSVGHPDGIKIIVPGAPEHLQPGPCENPAEFVSDMHKHPSTGVHYWCSDHLAQMALDLAAHLRGNKHTCDTCGKHLEDIPDIISNVNPINV